MDRAEFLRAYRELSAQVAHPAPNVQCVRSSRLEGCIGCSFSEDLTNCYRCTHGQRLVDCTGLTWSRDCKSCHASAYLEYSESCVDSAYLAHCRNCADCHHCVGCVGLFGQAFHILNQPYEQADYFEMLGKLRSELNLTLGGIHE